VKLRLALTAAAFALALAYFSAARGYPLALSLLIALAVAALAYTAQGTGQRLRRIHVDRPERRDLQVGPSGEEEPPRDSRP
jgi:hypothetical protein